VITRGAGRTGLPCARRPLRAPWPLLLVTLVLLLAAPGAQGAKEVPFLAARTNDLASLVSSDVRERIEKKLADLEQRTGAQIAVLTVDSLEGDSIEDYAVRVFQTWKLGRKDVNDGVLFVVARQERRLRIEVGYGLEDRLTDARSRQILDDIVRPHFRAGNFAAGIEAGVDAIVATVSRAPLPAPRRDWKQQIGSVVGLIVFSLMFIIVMGTFSVVALLTPGSPGWFLYLFLTPFYGIFPSIVFPPYGGLIAAGSWLIGFPMLRSLLHSSSGTSFRKRHGWVVTPSSGGRWSSSGSGGGYSGGGGGFSGEADPRAAVEPPAAGRVLYEGSPGSRALPPGDFICARVPARNLERSRDGLRAPLTGEPSLPGFRRRLARRRRPLARWRVLHRLSPLPGSNR
jgi:uncharacterized protein